MPVRPIVPVRVSPGLRRERPQNPPACYREGGPQHRSRGPEVGFDAPMQDQERHPQEAEDARADGERDGCHGQTRDEVPKKPVRYEHPGCHEEQEGRDEGKRRRGFGDGPQGCEQGNGRNARQQDQGVRGSDAAGQSLPPVRRVVAGEVTGPHAGAQACGRAMVLRMTLRCGSVRSGPRNLAVLPGGAGSAAR